MGLDRSPDLFAHRFYVLVPILYDLVIPMCGRLSWPALWSTLVRTKIATASGSYSPTGTRCPRRSGAFPVEMTALMCCRCRPVAGVELRSLQAGGTSELRVRLPADPRRLQPDVAAHRALLRLRSAQRRLRQHDALHRHALLPRRRLRQPRRLRAQLDLRRSQ